VDKAWKLGTGSPEGPCEIVDVVGMQTALEITNMYVKIPGFIAPYHFKDIAKLLQQKIDEGKLGRISGEGFYKYN
jgi:3-hydroxybutyryl-CoA dehydrogenase